MPTTLRSIPLIGLLAGLLWSAAGHAQAFHAGATRMTVATTTAFDTLVFYPTPADAIPWQIGPYRIAASHNAAVAPGPFPIILMSHGGGAGGGSPLILSYLATFLASEGFVVVAPFHGNLARSLSVRPRQITEALQAVLADPRFRPNTDPARLGMLGFSLGGAVTLLLAGATPNLAHLLAYCDAHPEDTMACGPGPGGGTPPASSAGIAALASVLPLKAIVLLDPFGALFARDGLTSVKMPALIYHPEQSALRAEGNALALAAALPEPPRYQTVPGAHFVFAACPPILQSQAPDVCQDPPDVDRMSTHARIETEIAKFFHDNL